MRALLNQAYRVEKCRACEFIYQTNVLNEEGTAALYGDWIDARPSLHKKQTASARLFKKYASQIEVISRIFPRPPHEIGILDFGMGWGYWSRLAQAFGYRVAGLELSPVRVAHARSLGISVIDKLPDPGPHYHFIFADQVFEHLPKPLLVLQQLRDRLTPDGVIYLRVPDGRDIENRLARSGWSPDLDAIHPLEHINCFRRTSLRRLATHAGLVQIQPPLRLSLHSLWGGIKREFFDRYITTHLFFRRL